MVGLTECTEPFWRRLGAALGWRLSESFLSARLRERVAPAQNAYYLPAAERARAEASLAAPLSARGRRALGRATACDAQLYREAARLAGGGQCESEAVRAARRAHAIDRVE